MPRLTTLVSAFIVAILCGSILATGGNPGAPPARVGLNVDMQPTLPSINKMPLSFTKNMGQWDDRVLFRANSGGATMWFTKDGITYQFTRRIPSPPSPLPPGEGWSQTGERGTGHPREGGDPGVGQNRFGFDASGSGTGTPQLAVGPDPTDRFHDAPDSIDQLVLTAKFVGANPNPDIFAEGQMEYKCNYFLGNDPAKWHTDVPNYEAITLKDIYPGIDLKYSGRRGTGQAAYEFIAVPGADIAQIKVQYDGAESTSLDDEGTLILHTKWGDMTAAINSPRPVGEGSGVRALNCAWWTSSPTTSPQDLVPRDVRQALTANSGTLTLSYSTYLGGSGGEMGTAIAIDGGANAYVAGVTSSSNFPTQNPLQTDRGGGDVVVTKLSVSGSSLIYSTYLGGSNEDYGYGIAVNGGGEAYITGSTWSSDFPVLIPYQANQDTTDVFVAKLSGSGDSLLYSTYLGGGGDDYGVSIAVDSSGNAYVTGYTASSDFPTLNPYQTNQGDDWDYDVFVTKLSCSGSSLNYSTYVGGESYDYGRGIAVDGKGNAYVTGLTWSSDFPTLNPYLGTFQGYGDAFVIKLSSDGRSLIYSTFLGGAGGDWGAGIAIDGNGNAYVTGGTSSPDFPTLNPYQMYQGGAADAFMAKIDGTGANLVYCTCLGGNGYDYGRAIAVNRNGDVCVTGMTLSSNFPVLNPSQSYPGYSLEDAFLTQLNAGGNAPIYSTYLGGIYFDEGLGIAVDDLGNAYVTGYTSSTDFPTLNPYQPNQGGWDAFVTKLTWTPNYSCGDVNTDEQVDLLDAVFSINYIFVGGPAPQPLSLADVNCSGSINIADVVLMINYIFRSGPAPCAECE